MPTTHYINTSVKLTIVTRLSFSERIAIATTIFYLRTYTFVHGLNQNAPRPSEHPPVRGENISKRLGGIKGCKYTVAV